MLGFNGQISKNKNLVKNIPLTNAYLGDTFNKKDIDKFKMSLIKKKYQKIDGDPDKLAAKALLKNQVVAVCRENGVWAKVFR